MKKNRIPSSLKIFLMLVSLNWISSRAAFSQDHYQTVAGSEVLVGGTSTLHDWESETEQVQGKAVLALDKGEVSSIEDLEVRVPVKSIRSGKSAMDKKTHEALEADSHPYIVFNQSSVKSLGPYQVVLSGDLNIGGVVRKVELEAGYSVNGSSVTFSGTLPIKMSDFEIDPPTALMGTIKTGDEIVLNYKGVFSRIN